MRLSTEQLDSFEKQGFLVLENFVSARQCENLRQCAKELVRDFEVPGQTSIFTTNEQTRHSDSYFLESGASKPFTGRLVDSIMVMMPFGVQGRSAGIRCARRPILYG